MSKDIIANNFNGYKRDEPIEGNYFRLPKDLFTEPYKGLSLDSKVLYCLLLDRMELSRKNGWVDEHGDLYIYFPREELKSLLGIGKNKVTQLFLDLKKHGLVKEKRQGIKKANIIFVGKIASSSLTPENRESRIPKTGNPDSLKQGGSDLELNKPESELTEVVKTKRGFSGLTEKPSPSLNNNEDFSEWKRRTAIKFPNSLPDYTLKRFTWQYKRSIEEEHPPLKNQQLEKCFSALNSFFCENDITDFSNMDAIIARYFETNFPNANGGKGCDYRFNHFATKGVLQNRFFEELY